MDTIIKQVIESEYRAQKIIDEVKRERELAESNLQKEILNVKEEIFSSANLKAQNIKAENLEQAKAQAEQTLTTARERASQMQKRFEENRDVWVKSLFDYVVNPKAAKEAE